jgi:hypothetical protein
MRPTRRAAVRHPAAAPVRRRTVLAAGAAAALTASCTFDTPARRPELLPVEGPVRALTWATENDVLLAYTGGLTPYEPKRLLRLDPGTGETTRVLPAEWAGENLATDPHPREHVFLPEPRADRVRVLAVDTFEELTRLDARAPGQVTCHSASFTLLALSEDGRTVTGVNTEDDRVHFRLDVPGSVEAYVETAGDRSEPAFWLVEPRSVTRYSGAEPPHRGASASVTVTHRTVSPSRDHSDVCYLAETGSRRLRKLDGGGSPSASPRTLARRTLPGPVEHVESRAKEEFRVYVATEDALVVLDAEDLTLLHTVDFRPLLRERGLGAARVSDLAVGDQHVFLALAGEPHLLRVRKPSE